MSKSFPLSLVLFRIKIRITFVRAIKKPQCVCSLRMSVSVHSSTATTYIVRDIGIDRYVIMHKEASCSFESPTFGLSFELEIRIKPVA